jgi:hypothetical protein
LALAVLALWAQFWMGQISTTHLGQMLTQTVVSADICQAQGNPTAEPGAASDHSAVDAAMNCPVCTLAATSTLAHTGNTTAPRRPSHLPPFFSYLPAPVLALRHASLYPPAQAPPQAAGLTGIFLYRPAALRLRVANVCRALRPSADTLSHTSTHHETCSSYRRWRTPSLCPVAPCALLASLPFATLAQEAALQPVTVKASKAAVQPAAVSEVPADQIEANRTRTSDTAHLLSATCPA